MNMNTSLRLTSFGKTAGRCGLAALLLLAALLAGPVRGEDGLGTSGLFTVDTRYGLGLGSGVSGFFTVDTRGGTSGAVAITVPPQGLVITAGGTVTFSVTATGAGPLYYQWRFNGANIPGETSPTLTLRSSSTTDSGGYSVVVSNRVGAATSSVAWLSVYLPPTTPQPPPPAAAPTTQSPPSALTAAPRQPSTKQMVVYTGGGLLDPNKQTIVMTHGWKSSSSAWPTALKNALVAKGYDTNANIVAWDWQTNADTKSPSTAAARTPSEGEALGQQLLYVLRAGYTKPIHFLGHSLGTMVNCRAADYIHGDAKNSPGHIPGSPLKFNPLNTHMTLFDEAELVTAVNGLHVFLDVLVKPTGDTTANLINNFWSKVIPDQSVWVDNYLSEVGLPHSKAANVLLWRNAALGITDSHGYACQWYAVSVVNPTGGPMGNRWSFEYAGASLGVPPARGSYYIQSVDSDPWTLALTKLDSPGEVAIAYPSLQAYRGVTALGSSVFGVYMDGIQYAGEYLADTAQMFTPLDGKPVYVGTANSTPAYFVQSPAAQIYQAGWDLQFTVQQSPPPPHPGAKFPAPRGGDGGTNGPVYVTMPVIVPREAVGVSFEFRLEGSGTNEYFTMGISNENYLTMEAKFVEDGAWNLSSVIEIPEYAGQQVQLFFGLNADGGAPLGRLSVRGIQFYSPPPPALSIVAPGANTQLSWPVSATGWQLETASALSSSTQWVTVTNIPAVAGYEQTVTNATGTGPAFFRLRK